MLCKPLDNYFCDLVMNTHEIEGNAMLCFDESGLQFQGVIHAQDDTQYAVYGTKTVKKSRRKSRALMQDNNQAGADMNCGCESEADGPGIPITIDIRIIDCEVGDEYCLPSVHGRNGENVSIKCKSISFDTTQTFKGQKADMESQRLIGRKIEGRKGVVYKGPIKMVVNKCKQVSRPWVL